MREVEVKYRVRDTEALYLALKVAGVKLGTPVHQDDQAYAPASWSYGNPKQGVGFARLRTSSGRHVFTLKRPAENALSCDEYETAVANREQMHQAVLAMGYVPTVRIVKTRRMAILGDVTVCVDDVDGLGAFLELERLVSDDAPGEVVQAELAGWVAGLGVDADRTEETYDSLIRVVTASEHWR